jgi:hypothetical protein
MANNEYIMLSVVLNRLSLRDFFNEKIFFMVTKISVLLKDILIVKR